MKQLLLFLCLFAGVSACAQQWQWLKVCDMDVNGTSTEWRYVLVMPPKKDTVKAAEPTALHSTGVTFSVVDTMGTLMMADSVTRVITTLSYGRSTSSHHAYSTRSVTRKVYRRYSAKPSYRHKSGGGITLTGDVSGSGGDGIIGTPTWTDVSHTHLASIVVDSHGTVATASNGGCCEVKNTKTKKH